MTGANLHLTVPHVPLPSLPPVADTKLKRAANTHSSMAPPATAGSDAALSNYEKLAHVGDSLLNAAVTLLLERKFPSFTKGQATALKSHLVSNETLSQIAQRYNMQDDIIAVPVHLPMLKTQNKCLATLFEARIAVIYRDFLCAATPGNKTGKDMAPSGTAGEAFDYLLVWLNPLFDPIARDFYAQLRAANLMDQGTADEDTKATGATNLLNQYLQKRKVPVSNIYVCHSEGPADAPTWSCTCAVTARRVDENHEIPKTYTSKATHTSKKAAMTVAAHKVAIELGLYPDLLPTAP